MSSTLLPAPELDLKALMALPESEWPDVSHLVIEDDTPVDNLMQEAQRRLLVEPLTTSWNPGVPFVAVSDVGVFDSLKQTTISPDMLLAMNVRKPTDQTKKHNRSYFVWVFGKVPDLVVEIVSNNEGGEGDVKVQKYATLGVQYYVIFDPHGYLSDDRLTIYELHGARYRRRKDHQLPGVKLQAVLWEGEYEGLTEQWLRWATPEGTLIPRGIETAEQERKLKVQERKLKVQESDRADRAEQLAKQERERAEKAEQHAKLLAEQLRKLGIKDIEAQ